MYPEIVKINVDSEIDNFKKNIYRILRCFNDIEAEAQEKKKSYLDKRSKAFDPDLDDDALIEEGAYFAEINHISTEKLLKENFLNSSAITIFHTFEKQKKIVLGSDKTNILKPKLAKNGHVLDSCKDWLILNKELRQIANAIKHGLDSKSGLQVKKNFPNLIKNGNIALTESDVDGYIEAWKNFWSKTLGS